MVVYNNILAGASGQTSEAAAFQIDRSLRFNDDDSAYLNRTPSSSSNETVWTLSFWIKLNKVDGNRMILTSYVDSSNDSMVKINGNGYLEIYNYRSGAYKTQYISNARFRDPSSWYHFVISANGSTSLNAWVNGVAITFSTSTGPDGTGWLFNGTNSHQIGRYNTTANSDFQLAEVQWVDGQALDESDFGEYDDNNVWQPKEYSGTYGTNGFYLKFADNSSNSALGKDSSGNGTNLPGVDFDGSGDHVESADHADYSLGTNDFTMECYIYPRTFDNYKALMMKYTGTRSTSSWWWSLNSSGHILFYLYYGSSEMGIITSGTGMTLNTWNHVACVRDGSTARVYINGVQVGTGNISTNSVNDSSTAVRIGEDSQGFYDLDAIMSNVRLVNGTCLYPNGTTFTVPSTPLANVTNTKLLCCQSSSSATAATVSPNTLSTSGDPFATTKNDSDWTVNNLSAAYNFGLTNAANILGTSKYFQFPITYATTVTYEYFIKITTDGTYNYGAKENTDNEWNIGHTGNDVLFGNFNTGHTTFSSTGLNDGEWHFVRLTTTGSSTSLYVDGSLIATNSSGGNVSTGSEVTNRIEGTGSGEFHMAHLRITTGGTPPTTGVPDISTMNAAAGSGGTLVFYDKLDDIASSGTKTSDGGNVTITMNAATVGVTDPNADSLIDTPTNGTQSDTGAGGEVSGNYATLNPLDSQSSLTLSNGNLDVSNTANSLRNSRATIAYPSTGKWYYEYTPGGSANMAIGIADSTTSLSAENSGTFVTYHQDGAKNVNGTKTASAFASYTAGDVIGVLYDSDANSVTFYKNNSSQGSVTPTSGTTYFPFIITYNTTGSFNFGARAFQHAQSTAKALCTTNLPDPTIADGLTAFDIDTYTGTGSTHERSNFSFSPDFLWVKARGGTASPGTQNHYLVDTVRGASGSVTKKLYSNSTGEENAGQTDANNGIDLQSDGFELTTGNDGTNNANNTYVAWAWDGGTSTASNTDGSITSNVRANQSAGFSVATYTSPNSSSDQSFGHGLNAKPDFVLVKNRDSAYNWDIYHSSLGYNASLIFTNAATRSGAFSAEPTSSVVNTKNDYTHSGTDNYVAYCWTAVEGYSAFGSYEGNGSSGGDGPFVYTGMRPRWIIVKNADDGTSASDWFIYDTARSTFNAVDDQLYPNRNIAEATTSTHAFDILSNGFKVRSTSTSALSNKSANTYIYAAFAENPFQANGGLAR